MPLILTALITIVVGALNCFLGYRLYRVVLVILGAILGFTLGMQLGANLGDTGALVIGLIGAVVGALLGYLLYPLGIVIAGASLGIALGVALAQAMDPVNQTLLLILIVIGGVVGALVGLALNKPIIMLSTALTGAAAIMQGVLLLFGVSQNEAQAGIILNAISIIGTLILALIGYLYQYRDVRRTEGAVVLT